MLIAKREPERIKSINAARDISAVHEEIRTLVLERLSS
jgi:thymidylate kinase